MPADMFLVAPGLFSGAPRASGRAKGRTKNHDQREVDGAKAGR